MITISEDRLEEAYELIEKAVWIMADPNEDLKMNDKTRATENVFAHLMVQFGLEEVT